MTRAQLKYLAGRGVRCSAKACTWRAGGGTIKATLRKSCVVRLVLSASSSNPAGSQLKRGAKGGKLRVSVTELPKGVDGAVAVNGPGGFVRVVTRTSTLNGLVPGRYAISADSVHAGKYSYFPTIKSSRISAKAARTSKASVSYLTVVPDKTKAPPAASVLSVSGTPGQAQSVTLDQNDLGFSPLKVGDVIALGISSKTPHGLLGRVVSTSKHGNQVTVKTKPATLLEAIPQGDINVSGTLSDAGLSATTSSLAGRSMRSLKRRSRAESSISQGISRSVSCGTGSSLDLSGSAGISPDFTFSASWGWGGWRHPTSVTLKQALFQVSATESVQLAATAHAGASCSISPIVLFKKPFSPIDIQIGPVPVVLFPTLEVDLTGQASASANLTASVNQSLTAAAGVKYDNGNWAPIHTLNNTFGWQPPTPALRASVKAGVTAKLSIEIYDLAGPYVTLGPSLSLDVDPTASAPSPWWTLTGILNAGVGAHVPALGLDWSDPSLISYSRVLAQSVGNPPPTNPPPTNPPPTNPPGSVSPVSAGVEHTCALLSSGTMECWGLNGSGELGNGTTTRSLTPVQVSGISTATQISAGPEHTCVLLSGGALKCWGNNYYGQLGNGSTTFSSTPVQVSGISNATAVSAGGDRGSWGYTCALLSGGTIDCWGSNYNGQLGNGTTTNSSTPVSVSGISTATQISAGVFHTCAVLTGGTVKCWGRNIYGELGNGTYNDSSSTPVQVSGISTATQISAGLVHTCALLSDGTVECWGGFHDGTIPTPVAVSGITNATQISDGGSHTCALLSDGTLKCWGDNNFGQLGNGTTTFSSTPVQVSGISNAIVVSAGLVHTCAVLSGGAIKCWGSNEDGQLGNGSTTFSSTPVSVVGLP
jgi:alpha-tubulin suppressor-like RCC1 family protein